MKRGLITGFGLAWTWVAACGGKAIVDGTGAASGAGGAGGASSTASTATSSTSATTTATTSSSGGGACNPACPFGYTCCAGKCVNTNNDFNNCGGCGKKGLSDFPYCDIGKCTMPPCDGLVACDANTFCCGSSCCKLDQLCCTVPGPIAMGPACTKPNAMGTCPGGCLDCKCAAPDTAIATPSGERLIAELRAGDLVYSIDRGELRAVRLVAVQRVPVHDHRVMRILLGSGRTVSISADHPLADGRQVGDVRAGDWLHAARVVSAELVPYAFEATYDILPDSDTGTYFAAGALIGSTMHGPTRVPDACIALP